MAGRGRNLLGSVVSKLRRWLAGALDQSTPFGRLALTHVVMTAGDTLLTISLAGSLFFSISPQAAKGKVILYLLLTMAPFALVAPLLGPLIDLSRGARRTMAVVSATARAVVCYLMAGSLHSLLLFPEAFAMLVLSKVYLVTKGSLVPAVAGDGPQLASRNASLGLLATLAGFAASLPAVAVLKLLGAPWVLRLDVVVFVVATYLAARLQVGPEPSGAALDQVPSTLQRGRPTDRTSQLAGRLKDSAHPEVALALSAMSVLKGLVGFLAFLLAFSLRRMHSSTWWYGLMLAMSLTGALLGVMIVPRLRRVLAEQQMLAGTIWLVALVAAGVAFAGPVGLQGVLALVVGFSGAAAKPAFDALVQHYVPSALQGRAFASFETKLQMAWVVGALIPVGAALPLDAGDVVMAAVAAAAGFSYLTGRRALRRHWPAMRAPRRERPFG